VLQRTVRKINEDHVTLLAAAVAFYAMLALVPTLIAAVSLYGLAFDPADLQRQLESLAGTLPQSVRDILHEQLSSIVKSNSGDLTLALLLSLGVALWSASSGMQGLMQAVGIAYKEEETRSAVRLRLVALVVTLAAIVAFLIAVALLAVLPAVLGRLGLGPTGETAVNLLRWPLLAALAVCGVAVIYRRAPDREPAKWRWLTWGAVVATALWLAASALFSWYVANFGQYNETYGSLGAAIVLMLWLWISALAVLVGAELNSALELQTARDTTRGEPRPMGQRGARVADELPRA
jgi:membrane protein